MNNRHICHFIPFQVDLVFSFDFSSLSPRRTYRYFHAQDRNETTNKNRPQNRCRLSIYTLNLPRMSLVVAKRYGENAPSRGDFFLYQGIFVPANLWIVQTCIIDQARSIDTFSSTRSSLFVENWLKTLKTENFQENLGGPKVKTVQCRDDCQKRDYGRPQVVFCYPLDNSEPPLSSSDALIPDVPTALHLIYFVTEKV
jgi:hypothetical protein